MKLLLSIPLLFLIFSCNENNISKEISIEDDTIHEMSIYQLPSVWNTQDGKQIEFKDLKGETLAVVMIYTACRTACPRLVADMRSIETAVSSKKTGGVKYVLVSIDPEADSPERLKAFAKENGMDGPQWLFLQGTEDGVRDFANILAVKYKKISPIDFSHSNIISVFDRQGVMTYQKEGLGLENLDIVNKVIETAMR
ncbi:MAG TPA: SCO family protein [Lunatimonas sp.]|nr:SCO family protein [Lunatimonas sp.]